MLVKPAGLDGRAARPLRWSSKVVALRPEPQIPLDAFGTVGAAMSSSTPSLRADVSIESARLVFVERGCTVLPVVDRQGMPIGIVTTIDLLRVLPEYEFQALDSQQPAEEHDVDLLEAGEGFFVVCIPERTVGSIMMPLVFTVSEHAPLCEAAALMATYELDHLPVEDSDGCIVGMISSLDIVRRIAAVPRQTDDLVASNRAE
jgi:CBS domain-containing protein